MKTSLVFIAIFVASCSARGTDAVPEDRPREIPKSAYSQKIPNEFQMRAALGTYAEQLTFLISIVNSPENASVTNTDRASAARILGAWKDPHAIPALVANIDLFDMEARDPVAMRIVADYGEAAMPELIALIKRGDRKRIPSAVQAVIRIKKLDPVAYNEFLKRLEPEVSPEIFKLVNSSSIR